MELEAHTAGPSSRSSGTVSAAEFPVTAGGFPVAARRQQVTDNRCLFRGSVYVVKYFLSARAYQRKLLQTAGAVFPMYLVFSTCYVIPTLWILFSGLKLPFSV